MEQLALPTPHQLRVALAPKNWVSTKYDRHNPSISGLAWVCREGSVSTESIIQGGGTSGHLQYKLLLKVESALN